MLHISGRDGPTRHSQLKHYLRQELTHSSDSKVSTGTTKKTIVLDYAEDGQMDKVA